MKILYTIDDLSPAKGGTSRSVPALVNAIRAQGTDIDLATRGAALRDFPVDLIHDHGIWLPHNHRVASFAHKHGIPRVVSPRGMLEPWAREHQGWKKRLAWWLFQKRDLMSAAALHATSSDEADNLRRLGLNRPVFVAPNGVDLPPMERETESGNREKEVLFLSRIHPKKGLNLWVEAWDKVRPDGWKMVVAGNDEGGHTAVIQRAVRERKLEEVWSFPGELNDNAKWEAYARASVFVLPSFSENFGNVVAEALAAGTPVITTTGTPWREVETKGCGWWVMPRTEDLAQALAEATSTPTAQLRDMGERGRIWVRNAFSWESTAKTMIAEYLSLLGVEPK